jgi:hypothetical protein
MIMPLYTSCPNGHTLATLPEWAGTKVKCPLCQEIVVAPAAEARPVAPSATPAASSALPTATPVGRTPSATPAAVDHENDAGRYQVAMPSKPAVLQAIVVPGARPGRGDDEDDFAEPDERLLKKPKRKKRDRLRKVRAGLSIHYAKYICSIAGKVLLLTGWLLSPIASGFVVFTLLGYLCGGLAAPILGIVGSSFCAFVPPKSGGRVLIIVSLSLESASLLFGFLCGITALGSGDLFGAVAFVFLVLGILTGLAGFILYMLFLRMLALYLREDGSADEATSLMILSLVVEVGGFIVMMTSAMLFFRLTGPQVARIFVIVEQVIWIVIIIQVLFRILELIGRLRARLEAY